MKHPVDYSVEHAFSWVKTLDFYRANFVNVDGSKSSVMYTKVELDACDPRLFDALEAYWQRKSLSTVEVSADNIRHTVSFWKEAYVEVPVLNNTTQYAFEFGSFQYYPDKNVGKLLLNGYVTSKTSNGTPFVIDTLWSQSWVACTWLDETYPDWKKRWEVSQALGDSNPRMQVAYILSKTGTAPDVTLTDMTF